MSSSTTTEPSAAMPSRQLLHTLFNSLANSRWTLSRTLRSDNPLDINGDLRGTATFTALPGPSHRDWLYSEEGELPSGVRPGLPPGMRWTKKYIWRGSETGRISVWFVKVAPGPEEADYLFHDFDFGDAESAVAGEQTTKEGDSSDDFIQPPIPPAITTSEGETTVLAARGNHLCINDMYRTAYAFRIRPDTGEVLSWASRHVVRGPKKDQDIINRYERSE
ncbi:hypothetical protein N7462_008300 [Penicillium macrosclerotiorum]|uniref:uncharacterized protein n=1 Tax=Penicillium macrosclerotiorum TaxID=303699 RepID=UPI002548255B|nr:uncharacterized protein N7462_008300 [Penicillium macrosclerotiorum]KAJ5675403.1 hypothetical protein N7462_008300 [Penicillium macrosclerotiorum]